MDGDRPTGDAVTTMTESMVSLARVGDQRTDAVADELTVRLEREIDQFHWSVAALLLRSSSAIARASQAQLCDALAGASLIAPCNARRRSTDVIADMPASNATSPRPMNARHHGVTTCINGLHTMTSSAQLGLDQLVAAHHLTLAQPDSHRLLVHPTEVGVLVALGLGQVAVAIELLADGCTTMQRWGQVAAVDCAERTGSDVDAFCTARRSRIDRWDAVGRALDDYANHAGANDVWRAGDDSLIGRWGREGRRLMTMLSDARAAQTPALSARECDIGRLLLVGHTHKEIGAQLYIAAKTVEHHVARMRQRLGCVNRAEFLAALRHQGL
jgi:DNA-binding CsgD family transcriptional regulator